MKIFSRSLLAASLSTFFLSGTIANPVFADTTGFLSLINNYRQQNNLGALTEDQSLTNSACWFASDMASKNYFPADHVDSLSRTMSQRLAAFGISTGARAENIFYTTSGSSASYAFDSWKNSSGHNANMLGPYTRIGIGRVNGSGKWYWVTDFADGSAAALNNQCGTSVAPPPPPPTAKSTAKAAPPPAPVVQPPPPPVVEPTPSVATISAEIKPVATKSAVKIVKVNPETKSPTMVQGLAATSFFVGNLVLFSFIVYVLFKVHILKL